MDRVELEFVKINPEHSFQQVMSHIVRNFSGANAIIHTGDLAQVPVQETYARYLQYMQQLHIPHFQIPGNHDDAAFFPFYREQDQVHLLHCGNWGIVLLNSAVAGKVDGWISEQQLQQLDEILAAHAGLHMIIACHHHPFAMQSHWIDQHKLKNADHLMQVIAKYSNIKAVLCGHVHQDSCNHWNDIEFLSAPSTSVQFKPGSENFALDEQFPGYRVMHLKDNGEFSTEVIRVQADQPQINSEISGY